NVLRMRRLAAFRVGKQASKGISVASGALNMKVVLKKMKLQNLTPRKYRTSGLYPMDGGMTMTFLVDSTLLFGEPSAVKLALDTRDGEILNVDSNSTMSDMMS